MVHIFYIHTSIKDLEVNHSVQYNAKTHDPIIIYSWCVLKCLVVIITTYVRSLQWVTMRVWLKSEWAGEDWFHVGINTLLYALFVACWCRERGYFWATYFLSHNIHYRLTVQNMLPKARWKFCVLMFVVSRCYSSKTLRSMGSAVNKKKKKRKLY